MIALRLRRVPRELVPKRGANDRPVVVDLFAALKAQLYRDNQAWREEQALAAVRAAHAEHVDACPVCRRQHVTP